MSFSQQILNLLQLGLKMGQVKSNLVHADPSQLNWFNLDSIQIIMNLYVFELDLVQAHEH